MSEHEDTSPSPRPSRRKRVIAAAVLGLLVLVVVLLPSFSTLQAPYYGRYPELRDRMDHWKTSTHGRVSCVQCHVPPGVGAHVMFAVRSIPAFYAQLVQGPSETNLLGAPSTEACQKCHTNYRQVSPDGDLLIPHRAHVEILKVECVACHEDLVHSENDKGFNRPSMRRCLEQCHDGEQATEECTDCHTRKHAPDNHFDDDWLEVHAEQSESEECGSCHDWTPDYCEDCHSKRPASHVGNWKTDHKDRAKTHGRGCLVCHGGEAFCKECH